MVDEVILGFQAKFYHGTSGSPATNELTNIMDNSLGLENGEVDVTTRATNGWRAFAPTLTEATVEFTLLWLPGNSGFEAIKDAFFAKGTIALRILDKAIGSGEGLDADFIISNFSRDENIDEALIVNCTARVGISDRAPVWETP